MHMRLTTARRLFRFYRQAGLPLLHSALRAWRIAK